ncbi:hypothetical protein REPUB_Repub16aG0114300 [Reevesia pubescens]
MRSCLTTHKALIEDCFDHIEPWNPSSVQRETTYWVILEEVPLQVWKETFFKSFGDKWGYLIKLDNNTSNRSRLDFARFLVLMESTLSISSTVMIEVQCWKFKVLVSIEDFSLEERLSSNVNSKNYDMDKVGSICGSRIVPSFDDSIFLIRLSQCCSLKDATIMITDEMMGGSFNSEGVCNKDSTLALHGSHFVYKYSNYGLVVDLGFVLFVNTVPYDFVIAAHIRNDALKSDNWDVTSKQHAISGPFISLLF